MSAIEVLERPFDSAEARQAILAILRRLDQIKSASGQGFPLYCLGANQAWKVSAGGSWLGGFWAGLWWLRALHSGRREDQQQALRIAERLRDKLGSATHHRSLIFWYGAGLGKRLLGNPLAAELAAQAADHLACAFDPLMGCIPLGRDLGGGDLGDRSLSVDPLAATLGLFALDANPRLLGLGLQQLQTSLHACGSADGAWSSHAHFQQGQWQVGDKPGNWSRGQAWTLLGLGTGARLYGEPFNVNALVASRYWLRSRGLSTPANRLCEPQGPSDPCSAAMVALALQGLATGTGGEVARQQAGQLLAALVRSADFEDGRFVGHCYRTESDVEQKVESACGSFFLLAALLAWRGDLDPCAI
ncbi:glucuronyl hydrolase [Pseudomonas anguilliseptica]|uniref:Unsaturated chondroitin disaccharide hydrolase n=1 Tax=Pseudomonas anguilliseptica TaxID=53406 RepID=A0A1H5FF49_PSEAG|nr:glucuronyl hydrolase [Pseudomonas anguilliseptica]SEE02047.1 unsaturated chondroitin disaccharide hydrolase [Pseudomonas anguilliseptica]